MQIGASTWLWASPLTTQIACELLPRMRRIGFDVAELPLEDPALLDPAVVAKVAREEGIALSVCGAFGPGRDLNNADARVRSQTLDYIKACLDFAAAVGAPMFCGPLYAEVGKRRQLSPELRREEWQRAVDGIRVACEEAASRKLRIAIEPLNRFETDLVHTAADAARMVKDVAHPAAGVMVDSFHMTIEEDNLEQAIVAAGSDLIHVQVSENQRGIPGTGLTDWASLQRGLQRVNYKGMVVIESFTPDNRDLAGAVCIWNRRAPDQDTFARQGLAFLQKTFLPKNPL